LGTRCAGRKSWRRNGNRARRKPRRLRYCWVRRRGRRSCPCPDAPAAIAQVFRFVAKFHRVGHVTRLKFVREGSPVRDPPWDNILAEEIEREVFVPGRSDFLFDLLCFKAFFHEGEVVFAIIDKVIVDWSLANHLAIAHHYGAWRIRVNDIPALDAAGQGARADCSADEPDIMLHEMHSPASSKSSRLPSRADPYRRGLQGRQGEWSSASQPAEIAAACLSSLNGRGLNGTGWLPPESGHYASAAPPCSINTTLARHGIRGDFR